MSYDTDVVAVLGVLAGYKKIAPYYKGYHDWLDSFDKAEWRKFLPRSMQGFRILDLGAGDGRTYGFFEKNNRDRYVALDVTEELLDLHPGRGVERVTHDVSQTFPFHDDSFDLVTSFFFLEHVEDLSFLFAEIHRVLVGGGRYIVTYFPQRRSYIHRQGNDQFKIATFAHRHEQIETAASDAFFSSDYISLYDDGREIGRAYCFTK